MFRWQTFVLVNNASLSEASVCLTTAVTALRGNKMAGLKSKSNLMGMRASPLRTTTPALMESESVMVLPLSPRPWGEASSCGQAAGGRSRRVALSSSSHDSAGRFSFSLFISSVRSGCLKRYCCDHMWFFTGTACPSCPVQTSQVFTLWPCVYLVPPTLAPATQNHLLRADP